MNTTHICVGCSEAITDKPRSLRGHTWHKTCADKAVAQNRKELSQRYANSVRKAGK